MPSSRYGRISGNPAEVFLDFGYPELKWLCLCFILLGAIFLIASIFSLRRTSQESGLLWFGSACTWGLFLFAVAIGGHGLWRLYQVAEDLVLDMQKGTYTPGEYNSYVTSTYTSLDYAGYAFVLGLAAYVATHVAHILPRITAGTSNPNADKV